MPQHPPHPFIRFLRELRRRRVLRVAGAYLVAAWIAIEVASVLVPELMLPGWVTRAVIVLALAGFPIALVLAWAYDLTSAGVERTDAGTSEELERETSRRAARPRRGWLIAAAVVLILVAGGASVLLLDRVAAAREREARARIPEVERLIEDRRFLEAYTLAESIEAALPNDAVLADLWPSMADLLTVHTEPAGAEVTARMLAGDSVADPRSLGSTPLDSVRVPRTSDHLLRIELDGYAPIERIASATLARSSTYGREREVVIEAELVPAEEAAPGAVFVPGGSYTLRSREMPTGLRAHLDDYFIDRYEVSNDRYREFVANGGYRRAVLWPSPIIVAGDTIEFQDVRERFVDRTGLPGPRGWTSQTPPPGAGDHPVAGVSWYEAAAYCAYRDMRLPSVFQWEKAARDGRRTATHALMPWGVAGPGTGTAERANFASRGTRPVDAHPFGISPYGAYAMAGNVKEWTANPLADGRAATGGSWADPPYLFSEFGAFDPAGALPSLGFRCARVRADDVRRSRDQGTFALEVDDRTPTYEPVDRERFRAILAHYRYDRAPLEPQVLGRVDAPEWVREKVAFNGAGGQRALAYLWLPKSTPPPHQTILYVPGGDSFGRTTVFDHAEWWLGDLVRSGRAIFSVVLEGMTERPWPEDFSYPETESVRFRELMVRHATDIRRGIDYLETRQEIDVEALAYVGLSWGAGSRLGFAAVDDRYDAVVLIGGGIDERVKPTLPEADNVNFAPYIEPPTLLLNGRRDDEHPWLTRALPLWNLLTQPKELVLIEDAGHVPPADILTPTINRFLDEHLGPVRR